MDLLRHLEKEIPSRCPGVLMDLFRHLEKEISFKVSTGPMDLLRNLEKEIPFKISVVHGPYGSIEIGKKLSSRYSWTLWIY